MPPGGFPPLQSAGKNQGWPKSGEGGYIALATWGVPTASKRWPPSEWAHKWARWLHNACRMGGYNRLGAAVRIRGGIRVGKLAT